LFARRYLESREAMPRVDRVLLLQAVLWALAAAAAALLPYIVSSLMLSVLAPLGVLSLLASGVLSMRRGHAGARYYLAAWTALLLGVLALQLHNMGVLPSNRWTANSLLIGSAVEMVLLSFALANRMEVARRFKVQAQARIAAERAMVGALTAAQQQLREALAEREVILANSLVGIVFLTPEGRLKWANNAFADIIGEDRSTKLQSMEQLYLSREQYLLVGAEADQAVAQGRVYERELQIRRLDGRATWVQLSGKAVEGGRGGGTVWVVRDVTQRKRLQEQLRATMDEREAILNNAVVGIVLSVHRVHEWVNDKFARMLGYPREQLIGQSSSYIHPDLDAWERFGVEARASLIATNGYTCERQLRRRDGELFWVEMGGSCVRANDPDSGVIWTFLDITGRKQSEDEMRGALEQQKALNELRSRFVAMTSHEFRT
ncbi:MAG: PAS domain S-box protein, partial [Comamonadaceae bacterium]